MYRFLPTRCVRQNLLIRPWTVTDVFFPKHNYVTVQKFIITDLIGEHGSTDWSTVLQHFGDWGVGWNGYTKGDSGSDMPSLSRSWVRVPEKPRDPPRTGIFINAWLQLVNIVKTFQSIHSPGLWLIFSMFATAWAIEFRRALLKTD